MVQFIDIPQREDRWSNAFSNLSRSLSEDIPKLLMGRKSDQRLSELVGEDVSDLPDELKSEFGKQFINSKFQKEAEERRNLGQEFMDNKSYDKIKETFGQKFADLWKAAPVGGKTELLKHGIDAKLRGANLDNLLSGVESPMQMQEQDFQGRSTPQMKDGEVPEEFEWPDYRKPPSGYTQKEWNNEKKQWRKENSPVFLENKKKLQNSKEDARSIANLKKLNQSKKLPEGFSRIIINPETGEIRPLAQLAGLASPEAQEWVKEIARFQNRAKDAFGSRVTNFDLVSYMKQFPSLLNTPDGRERILRMIGINNELDILYEKSLEKVYQKYGLNGLPHEEADRLAQSFIQEDVERLEREYLSLDEENHNTSELNNSNFEDFKQPSLEEIFG